MGSGNNTDCTAFVHSCCPYERSEVVQNLKKELARRGNGHEGFKISISRTACLKKITLASQAAELMAYFSALYALIVWVIFFAILCNLKTLNCTKVSEQAFAVLKPFCS